MAIFIVLWLYLLTTKLRCLQKNNIGHTNNLALKDTVFEYFSGCSWSGTLPPGYIDKEQFICDQCPNVYFNKISLRAHLRSSHSGKIRPKIPRERKCPHCEKTFLQAASYQEHIKVIYYRVLTTKC